MPTMTDAIMLEATSLPPEEAIRYLEAQGFRVTWDWRQGAAAVQQQAFTVAKVARMDILQDIHDAIGSALKNGETFETFRKNLTPTLQTKGWLGRVVADPNTGQAVLEAPWRLRTIFGTNMQTAYMRGREEEFRENLESRPIWEYVHVPRPSQRDEHALLHGTRLPASDPFWSTHRPPNGFGCACGFRALTEKKAKRRGGITPVNKVPNVKPDKGFEGSPDVGKWKPDTRKYSPEVREFGKRVEEGRP